MRCLVMLCLGIVALPALAAPACKQVAQELNQRIKPQVDATQLAQTLTSLNQTGRLPDSYLTKRSAQNAGWEPGQDLWRTLPGKSIGGDRFGNYENRLPKGQYKEADLDYRGGKRGAKRLIFGTDGHRYVTVDHYQTFTEVPPCQ
ncbi:ribonuclease domain-containing protein [Silvimonas iriomotensis]|uniref:Ribonuclease n=1 Tax=Silvimonas iriomotensis TaxID=449662 RepID=A0ABQ2P739_9NEIS|nr:ribonuclease domain-containing protein [Silvimonas iriomotensis]GGP19663.1 hypothetical protein GCM10010970_11730 [Silvimonas iriomotensis]